MNANQRVRETEQFLHRQIPLTRVMQVTVESSDDGVLTLCAPLAENHNHLDTAFGGSLAALAMLAGYAWLWLELGDREAHIVISESRMQFRRPVHDDLRATCRPPAPKELERFRADFAAQRKAQIAIAVEIADAGKVAVEFSGIYVARK